MHPSHKARSINRASQVNCLFLLHLLFHRCSFAFAFAIAVAIARFEFETKLDKDHEDYRRAHFPAARSPMADKAQVLLSSLR